MVEERGRVGIPRIDVVPDAGRAPRPEVTCRERGFSRTGRARDPQRRSLARRIELSEQALAVDDAEQPGPRELRETG
jgi:hypothetical protein